MMLKELVVVLCLVSLGSCGSFKIMSYNLFGWNALHNPEKTQNLYETIKAFHPDLLGVQEDEGKSGQIAAAIGHDYVVAGGEAGHSIMFRHDIFHLDSHGHVNLTPKDKWGTRTVQWAKLLHRESGRQVDYFNTHFCVCTDTVKTCCGQDGQYQSAKEVMAAIQEHHRHGAIVLLSGDLNVIDGKEDSKAIKYFKGQYGSNPRPLDDTFRVANGNSADGTTFNGIGKIDYIFCGKGTTVSSAKIDRHNYGPASDHYPINAVIGL